MPRVGKGRPDSAQLSRVSTHASDTAASPRPTDESRAPRASCYTCSMKKKTRRAGATETFSVSVDPETKRALRALADSAFGGNLSALVTDMAADARRRLAAGAYLRRHGLEDPTPIEADALQAEIDREISAPRKRAKRRVA